MQSGTFNTSLTPGCHTREAKSHGTTQWYRSRNSTSSSQPRISSHAPAREERPMQLDSGIPREPGMEGGRVVNNRPSAPITPQHPPIASFIPSKQAKRTSQPQTHSIRSAQRPENAHRASSASAAENRTLGTNKTSKCYEPSSGSKVSDLHELAEVGSAVRGPAPSPCRLHAKPLKLQALLAAKHMFLFFPSP